MGVDIELAVHFTFPNSDMANLQKEIQDFVQLWTSPDAAPVWIIEVIKCGLILL